MLFCRPFRWAGKESNLRPTDYESAALTPELPARRRDASAAGEQRGGIALGRDETRGTGRGRGDRAVPRDGRERGGGAEGLCRSHGGRSALLFQRSAGPGGAPHVLRRS